MKNHCQFKVCSSIYKFLHIGCKKRVLRGRYFACVATTSTWKTWLAASCKQARLVWSVCVRVCALKFYIARCNSQLTFVHKQCALQCFHHSNTGRKERSLANGLFVNERTRNAAKYIAMLAMQCCFACRASQWVSRGCVCWLVGWFARSLPVAAIQLTQT